jgi:hypothetical protein
MIENLLVNRLGKYRILHGLRQVHHHVLFGGRVPQRVGDTSLAGAGSLVHRNLSKWGENCNTLSNQKKMSYLFNRNLLNTKKKCDIYSRNTVIL